MDSDNANNTATAAHTKLPSFDTDLWNTQSPDELIAQIEHLAPVQSLQSNMWIKAMSQLQSVLLGLDDFAVLAAWVMGMNGKMLPDIVEMLETLKQALQRLQKYEQELPMTETLEKGLLEMYSEPIVFCAHSIAFFRNNPKINRSRHAWSQFSRDFALVVTNVRKYAGRVDEAADMIRLSKGMHTAETVTAIKELQKLRVEDGVKLPCFMVSYGLNLRFFGRDAELQKQREALDPTGQPKRLRAVGIHGLGGVGKSQLALHYANTSMETYEVIAYIPAGTQIKLAQSVSSLANKLGLSDGENEDDYQSIQKVRNWLNTAKKPFLLIFDNLDRSELLDQIWPASNKGSIIITTRSPSQASKRSSTSIPLESFSGSVAEQVLCSLTGLDPTGEEETVASGRYSYGEFLKIYQKSAEKVFAKSDKPGEYDHTVLTTWDISLQKPFGEAVRELSRTSMVSRLSSSKALSMHRLVQFTVFVKLSESERVESFDLAVRLLSEDFPNSWQKREARQGHGFESWQTCSAVLPHVSWLMELYLKHNIKSTNPTHWVELVFRVGTRGVQTVGPRVSRPCAASGCSDGIHGGASIRERIEAPESPPIADVYDSVACAYTEAGDVDTAFVFLDRATAIHNAHDPSKMARTLAIQSLACLRAGLPDQALTAIQECWRLQGMTQEQIEASRYPKHSGDIMLLARILWAQGKKAEAQELASRTIAMRRGVFGEKGGPRVADSLFTVARMLRDSGESVLEAKLLEKAIGNCGDTPGMRSHLARASWFLAAVEAEIGGDEGTMTDLRKKAAETRDMIDDREAG
ncbi:tpr repeat-containing protein [Coniochaeta sp. 2T2.1]|nr:tpr repeat-containing protein [Coniochaeta sp. 2T2.1]